MHTSTPLYSKAVIAFFLLLLPLGVLAQNKNQDSLEVAKRVSLKAEKLWFSLSPERLKAEIKKAAQTSNEETDAIFSFLGPQLIRDLIRTLHQEGEEAVQENSLEAFMLGKVATYLSQYKKPQKNKAQHVNPTGDHDHNHALYTLGGKARLNPTGHVIPLGPNEPCTNIDFEEGTTRGWNGWTGSASASPDPDNLVPGFVSGQHTIMTGGFDPIVGSQLPAVCPGGAYSLRLENTISGGHAARIGQTFLVTPSNANFTYKYAVVLEDPSNDHTDAQRPYFKVKLLDQNGVEIPCGQYNVIAKPPIAGFQQIAGSNYYWRNWTTASIPLTAYIGQNVTIQFTASDCSPTAHLGYAYIDGSCFPLQINTPYTSVCNGASTPLTAPAGFISYAWTGPGIIGANNTQTIQANQPGTYQVTMTSVSGPSCQSVLNVTLNTNITVDAGSDITICEGNSVQLNARTSTSGWLWSPATGLSDPTIANPTASPSTTTTYTVTSCGVSDQVTVYVNPTPQTTVSPSVTICPGNTTVLTASGATSYSWSPATGLNTTTGASVIATPNTTTTYTVTGAFANGCTRTATTTVTVPVITVSANRAICIGNATTLTASGLSSYTWSPATGLNTTTGPSVVASPTATTTYTVTGTDANSCVQTATIMVTVNPRPTVTVSPSITICTGSAATLTASGASSYTWLPTTGLNTTTGASIVASPTATTTYTVTGTNVNGCTHTATVTVTVNSVPAVTVSPSITICPGSATTLTASGASSYTWSPATGLNTTTGASVVASPTATTTYTVTGVFTNGCTRTATVTVAASPTVVSPNTTICEGSATTLTASGASSYSWSPATGLNTTTGASVVASPSTTTTYTVTGSYTNGCVQTATVTVTVNAAPAGATMANAIQVGTSSTCTTYLDSRNNSPSNCYGNQYSQISDDIYYVFTLNSAAEVDISHCGTGLDTYLHLLNSTGGNIISNDDNGPLCNSTAASIRRTLNAGTYYVVSEGYSSTTGTLTTRIAIRPTPITVSPNVTTCLGGSTTLTASGATSYTWSPSTGLSGTIGASVVASPTTTTTYSVTGTDANGCTSTANVTVTVNPLSTLTTSSNTTICIGSATTLTASGASSYSWFPATGLNTTTGALVVANPTSTTTYTVIGTYSNGCTSTATVTVTVSSLSTLSVAPATAAICMGGSTTLTASGAASYTWSPATGLSSTMGVSVVASPTTTTTYTVTGTDNNGCTNATTVTITVNPLPVIAVSPDITICAGSSTTLTVSGGSSYNWFPATGLSATTGASVVASPNVTTTYTITGTDGNGCTNTATITITVNPLPILTVSPNTTLCAGNATTLTASGATSYTWSPSAGLSSAMGASVVASPATTTTYTVTGTDDNGCINTATITVTIDPLPVVAMSLDRTVCPGEYADLRVSGGKTYEWYDSHGVLLDPTMSTTSDSIRVSPARTTTYMVKVSNENGCIQMASARVTVQDLVLSESITICTGNSTVLTATGGFDQYSWSPATGLNSVTTAQVKASPDQTTTYTVTATSAACSSTTKQVTVSVVPLLKVNLGADQMICQGEEITLRAGALASSSHQYYWSMFDSDRWVNVASQDSLLTVSNPGLYRAMAINNVGCSSVDTVDIKACNRPSERYPLFIPNLVTPNNDSKNDFWYIKHLDKYVKNDLEIFNRWGKQVYQKRNYQNDWQGEGVENGVYYYWLTVEQGQEKLLFKGWVHVMK